MDELLPNADEPLTCIHACTKPVSRLWVSSHVSQILNRRFETHPSVPSRDV